MKPALLLHRRIVTPVWRDPVSAHVFSDASGSVGWGGNLGALPADTAPPGMDNGETVRGTWTPEERDLHITTEELIAVRHTLHLIFKNQDQAAVHTNLRSTCSRTESKLTEY